jgi:hypothetical protein
MGRACRTGCLEKRPRTKFRRWSLPAGVLQGNGLNGTGRRLLSTGSLSLWERKNRFLGTMHLRVKIHPEFHISELFVLYNYQISTIWVIKSNLGRDVQDGAI